MAALLLSLGFSPPAAAIDAEVDIRFVGSHQSRTLVEGVVGVPVSAVQRNEHGYFNLRLSGEVLVAGRPYERFGYRYDILAGQGGEAPLALSFQRAWRPGDLTLLLEVEDLQSGLVIRREEHVLVPRLRRPQAPAATVEPAATPRAAAIRLLPPPPVASGRQRFVAVIEGAGVEEVVFLLDGRRILSRRAPPFSAELDLGDSPRVHRLRVEARGAAGVLLDAAEAELNTTDDRFAVELAEPQPAAGSDGGLLVRARVHAPAARRVERLEVYLGDHAVATVERPPWQVRIPAPPRQAVALRAVAVLDDGSTAEDARLLNGALGDSLEVDLVELYTAVLDARNRPVRGLSRDEFRVRENGREQPLARFEQVDDLPLHVGLLLDTSRSMTPRFAAVRQAAVGFLRSALRPGDQGMVVTFADVPRLRVPFTGDPARLANGLAALEPKGGTALYDGVAFALEQFQGIRGQRALLLLSDGLDERSRHAVAEVEELARRAAVTLYTIGIQPKGGHAPRLDRKLLDRLAEQTGGRSFYVSRAEELDGVYRLIEQDLRSRYLLTYYSSHAGDDRSFRLVDVEVARPQLRPATIRGYYP